MKSSHPEMTQRYLTLIKIDATNLVNRLKERQQEYLEDFSLKRDRSIFKQVFNYRYHEATMGDLAHLPIEIIELSNDFYTHVDELYWYLMHTQDMPNTIEEELTRKVSLLSRKHASLVSYIDVELTGEIPPEEFEMEQEPEPVVEVVEQDHPLGIEDVTTEYQLPADFPDKTASFKVEDYDLEDDS